MTSFLLFTPPSILSDGHASERLYSTPSSISLPYMPLRWAVMSSSEMDRPSDGRPATLAQCGFKPNCNSFIITACSPCHGLVVISLLARNWVWGGVNVRGVLLVGRLTWLAWLAWLLSVCCPSSSRFNQPALRPRPLQSHSFVHVPTGFSHPPTSCKAVEDRAADGVRIDLASWDAAAPARLLGQASIPR
ncbi:hypothetical protein F5Y18DRAFT_333240 [Xylariaceae sp. FL1019]|nr:hypothetical protein F5Y18DRAFT_333240 [Xylariaceae sp. FL1019]